jgi:hypothetical protein
MHSRLTSTLKHLVLECGQPYVKRLLPYAHVLVAMLLPRGRVTLRTGQQPLRQ